MGLSGRFRVLPGEIVSVTFPLHLDPVWTVGFMRNVRDDRVGGWVRLGESPHIHTFPQFHYLLDPPRHGSVEVKVMGREDLGLL